MQHKDCSRFWKQFDAAPTKYGLCETIFLCFRRCFCCCFVDLFFLLIFDDVLNPFVSRLKRAGTAILTMGTVKKKQLLSRTGNPLMNSTHPSLTMASKMRSSGKVYQNQKNCSFSQGPSAITQDRASCLILRRHQSNGKSSSRIFKSRIGSTLKRGPCFWIWLFTTPTRTCSSPSASCLSFIRVDQSQ